MIQEIFKPYVYSRQTKRTNTPLQEPKNAGVAKLGQRRKIQSLVLSGPRVQIPSPALFINAESFCKDDVNLFYL